MVFEILSVACIAVLFVEAEPLVRLKEILFSNYKSSWLWRLMNCALCSGFWIGLILTFNVEVAAIASVLAELIHKNLTSGKL